VLVHIRNGPAVPVSKLVQLHPKNPEIGNKECLYFNQIWVERDDISACVVDEKITLMGWGNAVVKQLSPVEVELVLEDKVYKNTKKFSWIAAVDNVIEAEILEFDHILNDKSNDKDFAGDFTETVNHNSKFSSAVLLEPAMNILQKSVHIQIQRRGFYIVDRVGTLAHKLSLIYIPDGATKTMSGLEAKVDVGALMKGKKEEASTAELLEAKALLKKKKEEEKEAKAHAKEEKKRLKPTGDI